MTQCLRLVIFDVDGTLVDSQADIVAAMARAFETVGRPVPSKAEILSIVGLSLDVAMARLVPDAKDLDRAVMVQAYKDAYMDLRVRTGAAQSSPLYAGARAALEHLRALPDVLLGVATGKSRRGLDKLIEAHGLEGMFATQQVADHHPSKPHPSMIHQAMRDTGASVSDTVMIGDTSFDMDMAVAAGVHGLGVSWGYHPVTALTSARLVLDDFAALPAALNDIWAKA
jgi:phosphoglycolate phosphatase